MTQAGEWVVLHLFPARDDSTRWLTPNTWSWKQLWPRHLYLLRIWLFPQHCFPFLEGNLGQTAWLVHGPGVTNGGCPRASTRIIDKCHQINQIAGDGRVYRSPLSVPTDGDYRSGRRTVVPPHTRDLKIFKSELKRRRRLSRALWRPWLLWNIPFVKFLFSPQGGGTELSFSFTFILFTLLYHFLQAPVFIHECIM